MIAGFSTIMTTNLLTILISYLDCALVIISEVLHGKISANSEFSEWVGIDVYISDCKYQITTLSNPWFSAAYSAAIAHKNYFFVSASIKNLVNLN